MMFRFIPLLAALILVGGGARGANDFLWEGFEREINWEAVASTAATGRVIDADTFSEGGHSLKLLFRTVADSGRAVYYRSQSMDWSRYGALLFDINVPEELEGTRVGIEIATGERWLHHEYVTDPLKPGWNRDIRVELKDPVFSSAASDYKPVGHLVNRSQVNQFKVHVYPGRAAEGSVNLDNIRLIRAGILTAGDFGLNATLDLVASGGRIDYLPPDMRLRDRDLTVIESFEAGTAWTSDAEGVVIEDTTRPVSRGSRAASVSFPASPDGFYLALDGMELRLGGSRQLRMDIYCAGPGSQVRLEMRDIWGGDYYSGDMWLRHGWNTRIFDFTNASEWGGAVDEEVLANLAWVGLKVVSQYPGRLVFDGFSAAEISLKGAARAGGTLSFSYSPSPEIEFIADTRLEDTFYGASFKETRSAGAESYLDNARLRVDLGDWRSAILYRKRTTALDQPRFLLISPYNLGREIAAYEVAGRLGRTQVQAVAATRLEYDTYASRVPTGFGPEGVVGLRGRRDLAEGVRAGVTALTHHANYGQGVSGIPEDRQTWGADLEVHMEGEGASLGFSLEGAVTSGDMNRREEGAPAHDPGFFSAGVSPEIGRFSLKYGYQHFGYYFDGSFTTFGSGWTGQDASVELNLEDFWFLEALSRVPIYDRSLGDNLELSARVDTWASRDRYLDDVNGRSLPRDRGYEAAVELGNDYKSKPSFRLEVEGAEDEDQLTREAELDQDLGIRLPIVWEIILGISGRVRHSWEKDLEDGDKENGISHRLSVGVERYFKRNLFIYVSGGWHRTRERSEGEWGEPYSYCKWYAGARQTLGANSFIEADLGMPALKGIDYGVQETLNVVTVTAQMYF